MLSQDELDKKMKDFIEKYGRKYNEEVCDDDMMEILEMPLSRFIMLYYRDSYYNPRVDEIIFQEIFSAIGALDKAHDPYYQMVNIIENEYGLDRNIIEVGSGPYPVLSMEIAKRQLNLNKGTVTIYDPRIIFENMEGIKIIKKEFKGNEKIEEGCLLVGQKPCNVTPTIIEKANHSNSEFFIELCHCNHVPKNEKYKYKNKKNEWLSYLKDIATSTLPANMNLQIGEFFDPFVKNNEIIIKSKYKK